MHWEIFRKIICVVLCLSLFGCSSNYGLKLYTRPSGALVKIDSTIYGETPCKLKIPHDSEHIKDHHINVTYTLDDGRSMARKYDLRDYQPPNGFARTMGGIIAAPGFLLIAMTQTSEDDQYSPFDKEDDNHEDINVILVGLGFIGAGVLVYYAFGGGDGEEEYEIYEVFEDSNMTNSQ